MTQRNVPTTTIEAPTQEVPLPPLAAQATHPATDLRARFAALGAIALVLEALVILDPWEPARAVAALVLTLVIPGYLLSYLVLPDEAPAGMRAVLTLAGSIATAMLLALLVAALFGLTRLGTGLSWAIVTTGLTAAAIARLDD